MSTIGKRIHDRRVELELSVDDLAERLGKNRATVYRYESDEIENLPLSIIGPLAQALDISPAYLMGWETSHVQDQYSLKFKMRLGEELQAIDPQTFIGEEGVEADYRQLKDLADSNASLMLKDACEAADKLGRSMSYMLQETNEDIDELIRNKEKTLDSDVPEPRDNVERDIFNRIHLLNPAQRNALLLLLQTSEGQENKTPSAVQD